MIDYIELHVYDFDSTLYNTPPYDIQGIDTHYLKKIVLMIQKYIEANQSKFENIDANKITLNENPDKDLDMNNIYELLYNNQPIKNKQSEIIKNLNSKIRNYLKSNNNSTKAESIFIRPNPAWYETNLSLPLNADLFIKKIVYEFRKSIKNNFVYTIILTGRNIRLKDDVQKILALKQLNPHELLLSTGGSTFLFKMNEIKRILDENKTIKKIKLFDDRLTQIKKFVAAFKDLNINYQIFHVKQRQSR